MFRFSVKLVLFLFFASLLGCQLFEQTRSATAAESQAISLATLDFIKANSTIPINKVEVSAIIITKQYARATATPTDPLAEPGIVFLQNTNDHWKVISVGTYFDESFYQQNHIPQALRLKY